MNFLDESESKFGNNEIRVKIWQSLYPQQSEYVVVWKLKINTKQYDFNTEYNCVR